MKDYKNFFTFNVPILINLLLFVFMGITLTSCELVLDIFEAGIVVGIIIVILVIVLLIWIIRKFLG